MKAPSLRHAEALANCLAQAVKVPYYVEWRQNHWYITGKKPMGVYYTFRPENCDA